MDDVEDFIPVPRSAILPIELRLPPGFRAEDPATWPRVEGRLEYVGGRLLYMPPCGDVQQDVTSDVTFVLRLWAKDHPEFTVGGNEAGMLLGGDSRGADSAVWRRADVLPYTGGYRRVPPLLAVEVAGRDEDEAMLRDKALWYLAHGVRTVWLVLPLTREVVVRTMDADARFGSGTRIPSPAELPDLDVAVGDLFEQLR